MNGDDFDRRAEGFGKRTEIVSRQSSVRARLISAALLTLLGVLAGFVSGLFGVGGGALIAPFAVIAGATILLGYEQHHATAISLGAVLIIAISGAFTYANFGAVNWPIAIVLALGSVVGAMAGVRLRPRVPIPVVRLVFAALLVCGAAVMALTPTARSGDIPFDLLTASIAAMFGLTVGVISTLLGVGGGAVVVPTLMLGFGAGDLLARGTSMAMMIPNSLTGTIAHIRAGRAHLLASALIGLGAVFTAPLGAHVARILDPNHGSYMFAILMIAVAAQLLTQQFRAQRAEASASTTTEPAT